MEERRVSTPRTPVEEELVGRVAWQIQLRWFAALGVLAATWVASFVLKVHLPVGPIYAVGLLILLYNTLFHLYLRRLERESADTAAIFDRQFGDKMLIKNIYFSFHHLLIAGMQQIQPGAVSTVAGPRKTGSAKRTLRN